MSLSIKTFNIVDLYSNDGKSINFTGVNWENSTFFMGKLDPKKTTTIVEKRFPIDQPTTFVSKSRSWSCYPNGQKLMIKVIDSVKALGLSFKEEYSYTWGKSETIKVSSQRNPSNTKISLKKGKIYSLAVHGAHLLACTDQGLFQIEKTSQSISQLPTFKNVTSLTSLKGDKVAIFDSSAVKFVRLPLK